MTDKKEIAIQGANMSLIESAVNNPEIDPEKLMKLLDFQERVMGKQAEIDFNESMARLQPLLPEIKKLSKAHNSKYAKYEHIERQIRPLYTEEGFSVTFNTSKDSDNVTYYGTLRHKSGHSETAEIELPIDTSGSKNAIQGRGSTVSYAKRYLIGMLFNIVTVDEDDDGNMGELTQEIDDAQFTELQRLIEESQTDIQAFCNFMKVKSLSVILNKDYPKAKKALEEKIRRGNV